MALCSTYLEKCISATCDNQLFAGIAPTALLLNLDQIASKTTTGSKVTGITMKTHCVDNTEVPYCGFRVQQLGRNPFEGTQLEMAEGTYGNRFNHTFVFAVNDNGPKAAEIVKSLANGRFVAIMTGDYRHTSDDHTADPDIVAGDNKYIVYGISKGLKASTITKEMYGDNESAYIVTLLEEGAPEAEYYLFDTDETTTDTLYSSLDCECPDEAETTCGD